MYCTEHSDLVKQILATVSLSQPPPCQTPNRQHRACCISVSTNDRYHSFHIWPLVQSIVVIEINRIKGVCPSIMFSFTLSFTLLSFLLFVSQCLFVFCVCFNSIYFDSSFHFHQIEFDYTHFGRLSPFPPNKTSCHILAINGNWIESCIQSLLNTNTQSSCEEVSNCFSFRFSPKVDNQFSCITENSWH